MKYIFYPLMGLALFYTSCTPEKESEILTHTTLSGSVDFAKVHELGDSKIDYDSKTGENIVTYTDWYFLDMNMSRHDQSDNPILDRDDNAMHDDDPKPAKGETGALSLRYGLGYVSKGAKFPGGSDFKFGLNYLQVPIDAIYHLPAGPGEVRGGLGPYFAYGIGGSGGGVSSFGQNNGGFKRFDAGLNFQVGYQLLNGVSLDLGYDLGLANVEYAGNDVKGHTRNFSINVGYQIGRLFKKK